jgi:ABC-type branched-subunit amino acid transport system substrate-binding protein
MKKKRLFILVGSMLAIPLIALCLIASRAPKEKAAPGEEVKTFHFGNLVALTGNMAALCVPASKGVELAVEEVNEAGGLVVGGQRYMIKLHTYDGRWDPKTEVAGAIKLVNEGCKIIHWMGGAGIAAQEHTEPAKVIMAAWGFPWEWVREGIKYTFIWDNTGSCMMLYPNLIGGPGEDTLFTNVRTVALLTENSVMAISIREKMRPAIEQRGIKIVFDEILEMGTTDFSTTIAKIKKANPDLVVLNQFSADSINFYPQAAGVGYTPWVLNMDAIISRSAEAKRLAGSAANGVVEYMFTIPPGEEAPDWLYKGLGIDKAKLDHFSEVFPEKYGMENFTLASVAGYSFANAMFFHLQQAGTAEDMDAVAASLESDIVYNGAMCGWSFGKDHMYTMRYGMAQLWDIDEVTGTLRAEYVAVGHALDPFVSPNWEVYVGKSIDVSKPRVIE